MIQDKQKELEHKNVLLSEENTTIRHSGENVDNCIRDAVNATEQEEQQSRGKLQAEQQHLTNMFEGLKNGSSTVNSITGATGRFVDWTQAEK